MEKSYVSLEQKVCVICGNKHDTNSILLDMRLKDSLEKHTVTGYGHCEDCQSKVDDDYIAMVEVSNNPSYATLKNEDAYRTGQIAWVKKHVADQLFNVEITTPMVFTQPEVIQYLTNLKQ